MLTGNVVLRKRLNYEDKTRYYVIIQANVSSCFLFPSALELIMQSVPLRRRGGLVTTATLLAKLKCALAFSYLAFWRF